MVRIKGYEINPRKVTNSHDRRAQQFHNKILGELKRLHLTEDDVEIELPRYAFQKTPASVSIWLGHDFLYYRYEQGANFAENLYMVFRILESFIDDVVDEKIPLQKFISEFAEDDGDIEERKKQARADLGLDPTELDMDVIDKAYKKLAKTYHPDMAGGDLDKFKKINKAHKTLRRALQ